MEEEIRGKGGRRKIGPKEKTGVSEGGMEEGREGGREGGRERGREGEREGGRDGEREGGSEARRQRRGEGGRIKFLRYGFLSNAPTTSTKHKPC